MRKTQFVLVLLAAFLAGLAGAWVLGVQAGKSIDAKTSVESTYERVMRTKTIRCGYVVWSPFLIKEPNTAQLSGIFYDYVEGLGKALSLKIEWTEEMGWSDFPTALGNGRVDAMCAGGWPNSGRARVIDFVKPIVYQPMYAYARADDMRFDNNLEAINDPIVTVATVEGATGGLVVKHDFPKARNFELPQTTSLAETLVSVVDRKADIVLINAKTAEEYMKNNPGKLHLISSKTPIRSFGTSIAVPGGQYRFMRMLDFATDEMISSGEVEKIITKYDNSQDALLRVALPYQNNVAAH